MPIANFPGNLDNIIQQGYLDKEIEDGLTAELGYRQLAEKEVYPNNVGETITRTRGGLLPSDTDPLDPSTNTNLDNGLSPQNWSIEQYVMTLNEYANTMDLNIVTQKVGIADQFLKNARKLAEQAKRSRDLINRNVLLNAYMGGNTRVTATLGSPGVTIAVDDIRGFQYAIPTSGADSGKAGIAVSPSNTMPVQVGATVYTLTGATADGSNVSTALSVGGISGTLTFSTNVSVSNGTAGNAVVSAYAPLIVRPNSRATTLALQSTDVLTLDICRQAVEGLQNNNVPGPYTLTVSPRSYRQLYNDPEFQLLFRGTEFRSSEYKNYVLSDSVLGFDIMRTNLAPLQTLGSLTIQRPILTGNRCLIEGEFEGADEVLSDKYGSELHDVTVVDDVFMVTRGQLDRLKQIVAQSYFFIAGWTAPTDQTINSTVIPTATAAYYKRAVVIETA